MEEALGEARSERSRAGALGLAFGRVLALAYVLVVLLSAAFADRLIFFPPPPSYGAGLEGLVHLETSRGDTVAAMYRPVRGAALTVIFAHGNAEDLGDQAEFADRYAQLGVSLMAFEYPGYGLSSGRPSEKGAYAAADAAYAHLTGRVGVPATSVVAHGRSLGGAVMVDLASRHPVAGLVIESSFVSAYRVMTRVPILPIDQFRTLDKLGGVDAPVLVIHGESDEVIAPWHGRRLYEALPEHRRSALWVPGAGHNDLLSVAGERYWDALAGYLEGVDAASPGAADPR